MRDVHSRRCLDKIGAYFSRLKTVYIYGAGENGLTLFESIKHLNLKVIFIDADPKKQNRTVCGCDVISPREIYDYSDCDEDKIVIVTIRGTKGINVMSKMVMKGYQPGINLFDIDTFMSFYLPILYWNVAQEIYVRYLDISVTQVCNLKCKECSICTPFINNPQHEDLRRIKRDIDLLFEKVDFVQSLYLIGGEPMIYPYLADVCEYIGLLHRDKVGELIIATNGLVNPKDELIKCVKKYNISFQISDYTNTIIDRKKQFEDFLSKLDDNHIRYTRMVDLIWTDYGFNKMIDRQTDLETLFDDCRIDCKGLSDGKLYYCFPAMMVEKAFNYPQDKNSYIELGNLNDKVELLFFLLGYNKKGYINMCAKCNGCYLINRNYVAVAEQL